MYLYLVKSAFADTSRYIFIFFEQWRSFWLNCGWVLDYIFKMGLWSLPFQKPKVGQLYPLLNQLSCVFRIIALPEHQIVPSFKPSIGLRDVLELRGSPPLSFCPLGGSETSLSMSLLLPCFSIRFELLILTS